MLNRPPILVHPQKTLERNLEVKRPDERPAADLATRDGFAIVSASGFAIVSASGFAIV